MSNSSLTISSETTRKRFNLLVSVRPGDVVEFEHLPGDVFLTLATHVPEKDGSYIFFIGKATGKRCDIIWKVPYAMMDDICVVWRI